MTEEVDVLSKEDLEQLGNKLELLEWFEKREQLARPVLEFRAWGNDEKELLFWRDWVVLRMWEMENPRPT